MFPELLGFIFGFIIINFYLKLRDEEPVYEKVKAGGGIGIPCFILEDGTKTLDLKDVLK